MKNNQALIIFTRNPELGKCKTRLAKTIGDESALNIYIHLLKHTQKEAIKVDADRFVFYSEEIGEHDLWDSKHFYKKLQEGNDLGQRMQNAFKQLFELGYAKVCIVGSDLLELQHDIIENAFKELETNEVVLGPALDGGYYLLGMSRLHKNIFIKKNWGSASVLEETLKDLRNQKVYLLQELNDIDTFEDMKHYDELKIYYN